MKDKNLQLVNVTQRTATLTRGIGINILSGAGWRDSGKNSAGCTIKRVCWILFIQSIPHVGRIPKVQLLLDQFQYLKLSEVLEIADPVVRILLSVFTRTLSLAKKIHATGVVPY